MAQKHAFSYLKAVRIVPEVVVDVIPTRPILRATVHAACVIMIMILRNRASTHQQQLQRIHRALCLGDADQLAESTHVSVEGL